MSPVTVRCFPSVDQAFAREVEALLETQSSRLRGHRGPGPLQAALRLKYLEAVVSSREALARRGDEIDPLWYVFRDGGLAARMSAPRRILVLDDDDDFAEMLGAMLLEAGFDVRRARDGLEGLDLATAFAPNLILLDLGMPRASGDEFAKRYRQLPDAKAHIVVVSGLPDAWKRAQATEARAVITKPFEMDSFLKLVQHLA